MEHNNSTDRLVVEPRQPKRKTKYFERRSPELSVFVRSKVGPQEALESWWTDKLKPILREEIIKANSTFKFSSNGFGPNPRILSSRFCSQSGTIKITAYNEASAIFIAQVVTSPRFSIRLKKNRRIRFGAEAVISNRRQVFL